MGNSKRAKPLTLPEIERAKTLSALGKSYRQIGAELGRSDKTIKKALTSSPEVIREVKELKGELADMFEDIAKRNITSISDADILKESAYRRTLSAAVATDKMRLLRGESTANIDVHANTRKIEEIDREIERLEGHRGPGKVIDITPAESNVTT
jgi:predicted transcriptional regulator